MAHDKHNIWVVGSSDAAMAEAVRHFGRLDILVNSAGIPGQSLRTVDVTDGEWEHGIAHHGGGATGEDPHEAGLLGLAGVCGPGAAFHGL